MVDHAPEAIRVLILDDYEGMASTTPSFERLKQRADVVVMRTRLKNEAELANALREAQVILLMRERTRIGERELALAPVLRHIAQTGRTSAHLDVEAATRRGISISMTASDSGASTVELTIALMLSALRQIPLIDRRMREEAWPPIPGRLIEGKTVGVVGLGRIGREVARICRALNARILATGRTLTDEKAQSAGATRVSLEELLRQSDIVTIHVPLSEQTRGLIGEKEFALMKPGAVLINTARGPIVSTAALVRVLEQGRLNGVGIDVYDEEPLPLDHPLRRFDNAILLPHRGYATVEILQQRYEQALANILTFLDGKPLDLMNPEAVSRS